MKLITSMDLNCFGMIEMNLAAALMVNLAREKGARLSDLRVTRADFRGSHMTGCARYWDPPEELDGKGDGYHCSCGRGSSYTEDGLRELHAHGWLVPTDSNPLTFRANHAFVHRIQRHLPDRVL